MSWVDWTAAGIKSQLGDELTMTVGESTSAILGLNGTIVMGNKLDYIIDPFALLSTPWQALAPFMGMIAGRNQMINGNHCLYVLGQVVQIYMQGRPHFATPRLEDTLATLKPWWQAANLCAAAAMIYSAGAGRKTIKDWADEDPKTAAAVDISLISVLLTPALVVLILAMWMGATKASAQFARVSLSQPESVRNPTGMKNSSLGLENSVDSGDDVVPKGNND